jgi:hypothetical protein
MVYIAQNVMGALRVRDTKCSYGGGRAPESVTDPTSPQWGYSVRAPFRAGRTNLYVVVTGYDGQNPTGRPSGAVRLTMEATFHGAPDPQHPTEAPE